MKTILTDRAVAKLVAPEHGRLEVLDAKMPGLALRVTPLGHKSWTVTWHRGRRARRHAIGTYPALTLATAREKARAPEDEPDELRYGSLVPVRGLP